MMKTQKNIYHGKRLTPGTRNFHNEDGKDYILGILNTKIS
jgi:hypothetical protein